MEHVDVDRASGVSRGLLLPPELRTDGSDTLKSCRAEELS